MLNENAASSSVKINFFIADCFLVFDYILNILILSKFYNPQNRVFSADNYVFYRIIIHKCCLLNDPDLCKVHCFILFQIIVYETEKVLAYFIRMSIFFTRNAESTKHNSGKTEIRRLVHDPVSDEDAEPGFKPG